MCARRARDKYIPRRNVIDNRQRIRFVENDIFSWKGKGQACSFLLRQITCNEARATSRATHVEMLIGGQVERHIERPRFQTGGRNWESFNESVYLCIRRCRIENAPAYYPRTGTSRTMSHPPGRCFDRR